MSLNILYQDRHFVAINKPHGLLVHRSSIAKDADVFALQLLRDQLNAYIYPIHRLDRKTGGALLFALNEEALKITQGLFATGKICKKYLAVVRGYTPDKDIIDYPLRKENGNLMEAITEFETIARTELDIPFGKHKTSRYSLVSVYPKTGRMHQIRKHFSHIRHPIIADRPHGCNKQNRFFKERWQMDTMLLHAQSLLFDHPFQENIKVSIEAPIQTEFQRMVQLMRWETILR
ncbi:pseudouridine synthase [Fulvivirgaceae bacterium BMA10]|uniref:Pseudouridine synthase n=1 Tax=Splendidivirga corallicola TaxID=3051826 RepID=A0ABT8KTC6_9BACT|nr:pseudouridine synthase [Fulvivirgaceae bacterium BMA10]